MPRREIEGEKMRRVVLLITLFFIGTIFFLLGNSDAASTKEEYEYHERCGESAKTFVKGNFGNASYTNHYNKKLNKCFALVETVHMDTGFLCNKCESSTIVKHLYDINGNKQYGILILCKGTSELCVCNRFDEICYSQAEWDSFVKPYMEE